MRRIRLLLTAAAAVLAILAFSSPASAAEGEAGANPVEDVIHEAEENGATHSDAECIEILAEGGTIDECRAAPSPILPETNEIIWGAFGFLVVFGALGFFGYPAIKKTMNERTEKIRGDIEAAEATRSEADQVKAGYEAQLGDAKAEATRIIEEARQTADTLRAERVAALDAEIVEIRQRAATEAEAAKAQALADLRGEVASIAIGAAERVVEASLDTEANRALIDAYIDQVGASR
ncbi:MAG TPA: F0F1 ATP synthase subunit B [Acidimicrobiales bacterium]|nr:F0F1 ATP synthase subunit B [Acidimicrobiales bacterium]